MTFKYLAFGLVVIGIIGFGAFALQSKPVPTPAPLSGAPMATTTSPVPPQAPHLEIVRGQVYLLEKTATSTQKRLLANGDSIAGGSTLSSAAKTRANVIFADGSSLRLDENTEITVNAATYDSTDGSLVANFLLASGRVWSKIVELATPSSSWEVNTPNAVATVRGTAFSTAYIKGKTDFSGSEHAVRVRIKDPKTKAVIENAELTLGATSTIQIKDEDTRKIVESKKDFQVAMREFIPIAQTPPSFRNDAWVKESVADDVKLNTAIIELKTQFNEPREFREQLQEKVREDHPLLLERAKDIILRNEDPNAPKPPLEQRIENPLLSKPPLNQDTKLPLVQPKPPVPTTLVKPTIVRPPVDTLLKDQVLAGDFKIIVSAGRELATVAEGTTAQFTATVVGLDGSKKDISDKVTWKTIGGIGTISATGLFTADLDASVAESGEAKGTVAVVFKNPVTGKEVLAHTAIFTVTSSLTPAIDDSDAI